MKRFDPDAFVPSYGLAESTLAVSFSPLGKGLRVDRVSREAYVRSALAIPASGNGNGNAHSNGNGHGHGYGHGLGHGKVLVAISGKDLAIVKNEFRIMHQRCWNIILGTGASNNDACYRQDMKYQS